jgi:hypothetical protein
VCLRQWLCARERPSCSLLHKTAELHKPTEQRRSDGLKPHRPPHRWAQCTLLAAAVCDRHCVVTDTIDKTDLPHTVRTKGRHAADCHHWAAVSHAVSGTDVVRRSSTA